MGSADPREVHFLINKWRCHQPPPNAQKGIYHSRTWEPTLYPSTLPLTAMVENTLTSLSLNFFFCKMGMIIVPTLHGVVWGENEII